MENVIIKFTADTTGLQPAVDQLKLLGKITDEDARKIDEINQSQARYLNTLKKTTQEAGNFSDEMSHLKNEIQAGVLEGVAEHFAEMGVEMEKTAKKGKTLKQELRELKQQIASGGLDAKQLSEATKRAAELEDHLGDVQQQIKALSSDTKGIDGVVEGFRALAAGVAVTQGVIGLMGDENKELEKTMLKVQSAMALLTGVQELAKLATDKNALSNLFLASSEKLAGKTATIMGVEISAATAVATAGISLLVAGLAFLITEMDNTGGKSQEMNERLSKGYERDLEIYEKVLNRKLEKLKTSRDGELAALKITYDREQKEAERKYIKEGGTSEAFWKLQESNLQEYKDNVAEINKKWDEKELKDLQDQEAKKIKAKEDANNKALQKQLAMLREQAALQEIVIRNTQGETRDEAFRKLTDIKKKEIDLNTTMGVMEKANAKAILEEQYIDFVHQKDKEAKVTVDTGEKDLEFHQETTNKKAEIDDKYLEEKAKKEEEYRQLAQQTAIQILENTASFAFSQIEQNLQQETDLKVAAAEEEQRKQLEGRELSASQQQAIERNTQREIARIKTEAARKQRQADVVQASINGAIAITKAYATMDPISASIAAVGIATLTGLQIAAIKNQPIPKFAKGTKGVEGPGTDTSDSILAYLSKGEMVIPTKTKESYFPALDLIFDKKVSPSIANELLLEASKGNYNISHDYNSPVYVNSSVAIDYDKLDRLFSKNKSTTNINMDESGFRKFLITENGKNEYLNKKFRK